MTTKGTLVCACGGECGGYFRFVGDGGEATEKLSYSAGGVLIQVNLFAKEKNSMIKMLSPNLVCMFVKEEVGMGKNSPHVTHHLRRTLKGGSYLWGVEITYSVFIPWCLNCWFVSFERWSTRGEYWRVNDEKNWSITYACFQQKSDNFIRVSSKIFEGKVAWLISGHTTELRGSNKCHYSSSSRYTGELWGVSQNASISYPQQGLRFGHFFYEAWYCASQKTLVKFSLSMVEFLLTRRRYQTYLTSLPLISWSTSWAEETKLAKTRAPLSPLSPLTWTMETTLSRYMHVPISHSSLYPYAFHTSCWILKARSITGLTAGESHARVIAHTLKQYLTLCTSNWDRRKCTESHEIRHTLHSSDKILCSVRNYIVSWFLRNNVTRRHRWKLFPDFMFFFISASVTRVPITSRLLFLLAYQLRP